MKMRLQGLQRNLTFLLSVSQAFRTSSIEVAMVTAKISHFVIFVKLDFVNLVSSTQLTE